MSNNKNMGGQIIVEDNASPPTQIIIQPSESAADRGVEGDDPAGSSGAYQPEFVLLNSIGGVSFDGGVEDGLNGETGTRKEMDGGRSDEPRPTMIYANVGGGSGAAGDSSSILPVVYTDIADPPTTSSLVRIVWFYSTSIIFFISYGNRRLPLKRHGDQIFVGDGGGGGERTIDMKSK